MLGTMTDDPLQRTVNDMRDMLAPLGYRFEQRQGTGWLISRDDDSLWERRVNVVDEILNLIGALQKSPTWRLDLRHGRVDFDPETLEVTPHDGEPFKANHYLISGFGGEALITESRSQATELYAYVPDWANITPQELPFGGAWHKWI